MKNLFLVLVQLGNHMIGIWVVCQHFSFPIHLEILYILLEVCLMSELILLSKLYKLHKVFVFLLPK